MTMLRTCPLLPGGREIYGCAFSGTRSPVGVGDPSGVGWVGRVAAAARAHGHDLTAYNLGVRRDTSLDLSSRWLGEARGRLKDGDLFAVVFAFGINDVDVQLGLRRVPRDRSLSLLADMLAGARAVRWPALVIGPPPVLDRETSERAADLAAGMEQVCTSRGVPFVDVTAKLGADPIWRQEVAAGDAFHPSTRGYAQLATLIAPPILQWLTELLRGRRNVMCPGD